MQSYGYDIGSGWCGRVEEDEFMEFATESEYDEYIEEE